MQFSVVKNGAFEDGMFGPDVTFNTVGQKMGNSYNPAIFIHQAYDNTNKKLAPIDLNGLSVELISKNSNGDITIKIRYDDTRIVQTTRWTGELRLLDVPSADQGYDLLTNSYTTLLLDRSGTPNRTTKTAANDFINPTSLTCVSGSSVEIGYGANLVVQGAGTAFTLQSGSSVSAAPLCRITVKAGSVLDIQGGSTFNILGQGQLIIEAGGTLVVLNGATLDARGTVEVQAGAYICTEANAVINVNSSTAFAVSPSATRGTNPALGLSNLACASPKLNCPPITFTGTYFCSNCTDRSTKTLQEQNSVSRGTYHITLTPSTENPNPVVFQPWIFGDIGGQGAYNTNSNRTGVITLSGYNAAAITAKATADCSSGERFFRFFATYSSFAVTPNPTSDELQIEAQAEEGGAKLSTSALAALPSFEIKLYNPFGQLVRIAKSQQGRIKVDVRNLPTGLYTLRIGSGRDVTSEHIQILH